MKKNYITTEINVIQLDTLCGGTFMVASVLKSDGECVSTFGVLDEEQTKDKDLWGESNSDKWGDD